MDPIESVVLDSNVCITSALDFGKIGGTYQRDYFCNPSRNFINGCLYKSIRIGYFPPIKQQAWNNITEAIKDLGDKRGIRPAVLLQKSRKVYDYLEKLFARLDEYDAITTEDELDAARKFFKDNEKDVVRFLNLQHYKNNIPEDHDLEILVSSHNLDCCNTHLVSDDGHFVAYKDEINSSDYLVTILPMKELNQILISLNWPNPS
jgi:hypothetical protein